MRLVHERLDLETAFEFRISREARRVHANAVVLSSTTASKGWARPLRPLFTREPGARRRSDRGFGGRTSGTIPSRSTRSRRAWTECSWRWAAARQSTRRCTTGSARSLGLPVWRLLGLDPARTPRSCVTLGLASPEEMERKLETVSTSDPQGQARFPGTWTTSAGSGRATGKMRVDANAAWSPAEAVRVLRSIEALDIELVEQPVAAGDLDGLRWVRERSGIPSSPTRASGTPPIWPIFPAGERRESQADEVGGLREMLRTIHAARALGLRVMLGSMVESSLALSARPSSRPWPTISTWTAPWLLARDPFDGAPRERAASCCPIRPGLGVVPAA